MPSFRACFGSIFRIHTETGNIWTHLLGEDALTSQILPAACCVKLISLCNQGIPLIDLWLEEKMIEQFVILRADPVPLSGHINHAKAQHVLYGSPARESGVWDVLPGSCALPQFLLAFSHRLLPL